MRTLLLSFLIFMSSGLALASIDPDNEQNGLAGPVDEQGRKQGHWVYLGKHKKRSGYPDESKVEEGNYKDDRKEGEWINYYISGEIQAKRTFENGVVKGAFVKYDEETGKVTKKGAIDKSKGGYQGKLELNYADGTPKARMTFVDGKEHGESVKYHPNGKPALIYNMSNGVKSGKATYYYPNGDVMREVTYGPDGKATSTVEKERVNPEEKVDVNPDGKKAVAPTGADLKGKTFKPNDFNKLYDKKTGEIWQDGLFKNGKLWDGKIYIYDEDGLIKKVEVYKNGKYYSDGQM